MDRPHRLITVGLRTGFDRYDLTFPLPPPTPTGTPPLDLTHLVPFRDRTRRPSPLPDHDRIDDTTSPFAARLADYDQFLAWLSQRTARAPGPLDRLAWYLAWPRQRHSIAAIDDYIRARLFDRPFDPGGERWRLLLLPAVLDTLTEALAELGPTPSQAPYRLSERRTLTLPAASAVPVEKCIYTHQAVADDEQQREGALLTWARVDPGVLAICRIEPRHPWVRIAYRRKDGSDGVFVPDFLVRMAAASYLVTLHTGSTGHERQRRMAVIRWCARANDLPQSSRGGPCWYYAPLDAGELAGWRRPRHYLGDVLARAQWQASYQARVDGGAG